MAESTEKADNVTSMETPARPRSRMSWFPILWTGLIAGGCLLFLFTDYDRDVKNTVCLIAAAVTLLGLTTWFTFGTRYSARTRWGIGLTPWLLIAAFFSAVELVNDGDIGIVSWRWRLSPKPDQRLAIPEMSDTGIVDWGTSAHDYPRFLGEGYWAEVADIELDTDWDSNPPQELWRTQVGAGWSGFALVGNYAFTQEQRGDHELVVCYQIATDDPEGEMKWTHADSVRFDPRGTGALGGVGPRATPTVYKDKVYTMGATGILNCLDARSGDVIWSRNTLEENNAGNIMWGKSSSPLIVENEGEPAMLVVSVGGTSDASLIAYDVESGDEIWAAGNRRSSYASPVETELLGVRQILSVNEDFVTAHRVEDGEVLWEFPWPGNSDSNATVSQPVPVGENRIFLSKGYTIGSALLEITWNDNGEMEAVPLWNPPVKQVMKTKMSNVVVRDGFVYGLDGGLMQCIDLETGENMWKKRRRPAIGHGQIMLVGETILILSESGEVILIAVDPKKYRELASMRVFPEDQVTWNNPSFSTPYLLVRNAQQAACFKLQVIESDQAEIASLD